MRRFITVAAIFLGACAAAPAPAPVAARGAPSRATGNAAAPPTPHFAATAPPLPAFEDPERGKKIAQLAASLGRRVDTFFEKEKPPSLAVAMVADGKVVFTRFLGKRDKATKAPATERTMYRIGAVTKTFTAALALSLR